MAGCRAGESLNQLELVLLLLLLLDLLLLLLLLLRSHSPPRTPLKLAGRADAAEVPWIIFD